MPSDVFKLADTRYIAAALANNTTHDGIGTFELTLGVQTTGNKGERANQVVRRIFALPDTDRLVIELLNYLYVENPYADTTDSNPQFKALRENVLEPRSVVLTDDGYVLPDGRDVSRIERTTEAMNTAPSEPSSAGSVVDSMIWSAQVSPQTAIDAGSVFVVHGRDDRPVAVLNQFLHFLGLRMMTWSEAVRLTNNPQPHTYDVVKAGITRAAAVIVLFSPDDLARVKDEFSADDDPDRTPQGQSRQNVILEAGMAFALAPERTVFVKSAPTRDISDIAGFNWVKMDGAWDSRQDLKQRLESARAAVRPASPNLADPLAGEFKVTSQR